MHWVQSGLLAVIGFGLAAAPRQASAETAFPVLDGPRQATIVCQPNAPKMEDRAVGEMAKYLREATGEDFAVVTETQLGPEEGLSPIYVGDCQATRAALSDELAGVDLDSSSFSQVSTEYLPLPVLALTSSLLHAGWLHLLGNMWFLWVFGNAMNYKLGQLGYLGLYVLVALAGGMAHYAFVGSPVVGASGVVNGVMGAFLVFFPRNDVKVLWIIWIRPVGPGRSPLSYPPDSSAYRKQSVVWSLTRPVACMTA